MNILIVEDEERVADFLRRGLRAELHNVNVVSDGEAAIEAGLNPDLDLIILDLMLPKVHGREVCQTLRQRNVSTPILMLTALDKVDDRIDGLRTGADDYMSKPFSFDELLARIEALTRRLRQADPGPKVITFADLVFDRNTLQVMHGGEALRLTAKELALIELLLSTPGKIFSRERILSNVWDSSHDPLTNVVDVYIGRLRKQLKATGGSVEIETLRAVGYRLVAKTRPVATGL